jgi:ClpP class serine protease
VSREQRKRAIKHGEALAIDPSAVRAGPEAFFWLWSSPCPCNERVGDAKKVAVVHVRGPLDHHDEGWGDSYDAIRARVESALSGADVREELERRKRWGDAEEGETADDSPPSAVLLRLDSPGGVVSGLNETVKALRKMGSDAGIPLIAYVDEMATSAAYALACACDEVYLPASGIAGSIGVISTMADQTEADKRMGIRVVTITSGARKSDGHPHVPISDDAVDAEQGRVDKLARQFYRLVEGARLGLSAAKIKGYEAGIFLGSEAVDAGLADGVMAFDEVVGELASSSSAKPSLVEGRKEKGPSMLKIKNLVASTKAAISKEKDPKLKAKLAADLKAYEATLAAVSPSAKIVHKIDHKETHTSDDGDEEKDDEEEAEGNETDRSDEPEDDEEKDDDEEDDDEEAAASGESEEEAAAGAALRSALSGVKDKKLRAELRGKLAALASKAASAGAIKARLHALEQTAKSTERASLLATAKARGATPHQQKMLATKKLGFVRGYVGMMPVKPLVASSKGELLLEPAAGATPGQLEASLEQMIANAIAASGGKVSREEILAAHKAEMKTQNGAGGAGGY